MEATFEDGSNLGTSAVDRKFSTATGERSYTHTHGQQVSIGQYVHDTIILYCACIIHIHTGGIIIYCACTHRGHNNILCLYTQGA